MSKSFRVQLAEIDAKITKLQESRAEVAAKADAELDTARIEQGSTITFDYGRAEKRRILTGTVLGRKAQPKGADLLKVLVGEGVDAELLTVVITAVTQVGAAEVTAEQV